MASSAAATIASFDPIFDVLFDPIKSLHSTRDESIIPR